MPTTFKGTTSKAGFIQKCKLLLGLETSTNFSCLKCGNIFSVMDKGIPENVRYGEEQVLCPKCGKPARISVVQSAEDLKHL